MKNRDNLLLSIRPSLDLTPATSPIEQFQNNTLRPILKFQNDLILQMCIHQFKKRKSVFFGLGELAQLDYIEQQIDKDKNFKTLLFSTILSHLTIAEYLFFTHHEHPLRKRMTSLLIQRIQSQRLSLIS